MPRLSAPVRALWAAQDGSLWLGFGEPGGVVRLLNNDIHTYIVTTVSRTGRSPC